jgi:hypothetical protein
MEQNLTNNDEVMDKVAEVTEEVVKAAPKSNKGLKIAGYGVAVVVGVALCHFAVEPAISKIGNLIRRKTGRGVTWTEDDDIIDVETPDDNEEDN